MKVLSQSPTQVGVVVQWLDYLAVTQEPGVRFPTADEVPSDVATLDVGYCRHGDVVRPQPGDPNSHTVAAHDQSCVEVLGKPFIPCRLCPPSSDGYLVERES